MSISTAQQLREGFVEIPCSHRLLKAMNETTAKELHNGLESLPQELYGFVYRHVFGS